MRMGKELIIPVARGIIIIKRGFRKNETLNIIYISYK